MKTYLINLARNPERLAFMRGQFEARDMAFERFEAVDGKALSREELHRGFSPVRSFIAAKKRLSQAEVAVAMSHVGVYRRMIADDVPVALVFEDDVRLGADVVATLSRVSQFVDPARAQLVVLSGYGVEHAESLPAEIRPEKSVWCADAYVLTREAAKLIVRANDPVITVADSFKRWRRYFGLELYRALPASVCQDDATFASENVVLPKSNWLLRNVLWLADRVLIAMRGR